MSDENRATLLAGIADEALKRAADAGMIDGEQRLLQKATAYASVATALATLEQCKVDRPEWGMSAGARIRQLERQLELERQRVDELDRKQLDQRTRAIELASQRDRFKQLLQWVQQTVHQGHHEGERFACRKSVCAAISDALLSGLPRDVQEARNGEKSEAREQVEGKGATSSEDSEGR
jgi:hypothetical protein